MILLHKFGSEAEAFYLNPELLVKVDSRPDTIIHLLTGQEVYVQETPQEVVELVRDWKVSLLKLAGGED